MTDIHSCSYYCDRPECIKAQRDELRSRLAQPEQEPVSIRAVAKQAGINLPETYISTMDDAIAAGDSVLMDEQAALLRECRAALDSLIAQKPTIAGLVCGSTTLGNLKAELGAYRPQGVFGSRPQAREQPPQRDRLAQPEQEPVACVQDLGEVKRKHLVYEKGMDWKDPLYTTPPQRKPLTDGELADLWYKQSLDWLEFARAIEAALDIKENT